MAVFESERRLRAIADFMESELEKGNVEGEGFSEILNDITALRAGADIFNKVYWGNMEKEMAEALSAKLKKENRELRKNLSKTEKELDQALKDLRMMAHMTKSCHACAQNKFDYNKGQCIGCQYDHLGWEWRGLEDGG